MKYAPRNNMKRNINSIPTAADTEEDTNMVFSESGIFKTYYKLATNYVKNLTLDQKIGQLLLVKYKESDTKIHNYSPAGFILYEDDFADKTKVEVINMIKSIQSKGKIPYLISVDEEGGNVVRVSSNNKLVEEMYKSPSYIYNHGGIDAIKQDTVTKNKELYTLGINVNLAPVVDVSLDNTSYIYERTLKEDVEEVSRYAKAVITSSKNTGMSNVLKHFPGYGDSTDTHTTKPTNNREYNDIKTEYLPPFEAGIDNGAEAVLVNHIIYTNIDDTNPASLSRATIKLLRDSLNFTGVVISDDLEMGALEDISNVYSKAIKAGNDLLIVDNYSNAIKDIKKAIIDEELTENEINDHAARVIAWKYYKGLMNNTTK